MAEKKGKLKMYFEYFKYIMEHKKNVFKTCWKRGLYIHAFTHDLSKFSPAEFIPYTEWFHGENGVKLKNYLDKNKGIIDKNEWIKQKKLNLKLKSKFDEAWIHHFNKNKHHWNHWIGERMPDKYIIQMICDWEAMSLKFGDTAQEFYMNNHHKIDLHLDSRLFLEFKLGLIGGEALISGVDWKTYCQRMGITMREDLKTLGYIKNVK